MKYFKIENYCFKYGNHERKPKKKTFIFVNGLDKAHYYWLIIRNEEIRN